MLLFGSKQKKAKKEDLYLKGREFDYRGPVSEMPLAEPVILQASITFFNDSNPCEIHRSAVRLRLTAEFEKMLKDEAADAGSILHKAAWLTGREDLEEVRCGEKSFQKS